MLKTVTHPLIGAMAIALSSLVFSSSAQATTVQVQTSLGEFEVNLYDEATPSTVANFLAYVEDGDYENTIIHRSVKGFILQGGGFTYSGSLPFSRVETNPPVVNEPVYSNVRGTIVMAKLPDDPNSATNQWFINLDNNSAHLDVQNGGFTVFGEVVAAGMDVVDSIVALPVKNDLPLRDFASGDTFDADSHLVLINNIVVLDASVDTAADASPTLNTLLNKKPRRKKSGAVSVNLLVLLLSLNLIGWARARRRYG